MSVANRKIHRPSVAKESENAKWTLEGQPQDGAPGQRITIETHPFRIGRSPGNEFSPLNPTVSGFHAELILVLDDIFVRDLASTNGTLLNGTPVDGVSGLIEGDILHFGTAMYTLTRRRQQTHDTETATADSTEDALGQLQFEKLFGDSAVQPHFQPIVRLADASCVAYEALCRSKLLGLDTPAKMFRIASQRGSSIQLSEVCRYQALQLASAVGIQEVQYLNTHPAEVNSPRLIQSLSKLRSDFPNVRLVLEIHEAAIVHSTSLLELRAALRDLDIQLAYDDFGAGQTRLMELAKVPPDVLKFDISIVRELPVVNAAAYAAVRALVQIALDLGVDCLAEGIETEEQHACCREIGFALGQGYLFGRPQPASCWPQDAN